MLPSLHPVDQAEIGLRVEYPLKGAGSAGALDYAILYFQVCQDTDSVPCSVDVQAATRLNLLFTLIMLCLYHIVVPVKEVLVMLEAKSVQLQDGVGQLLAQMGAVRHKRKRESKKVRSPLCAYVCDGIS